jgi:hypothetical protein
VPERRLDMYVAATPILASTKPFKLKSASIGTGTPGQVGVQARVAGAREPRASAECERSADHSVGRACATIVYCTVHGERCALYVPRRCDARLRHWLESEKARPSAEPEAANAGPDPTDKQTNKPTKNLKSEQANKQAAKWRRAQGEGRRALPWKWSTGSAARSVGTAVAEYLHAPAHARTHA